MSAPFDPTSGGSAGPGDSGAPVRPKLPDSIKIASELWIVVVLGQIVAFFAQYSALAKSIRDSVHEGSAGVPADQLEFMTSTGFIVALLIGVAVVLSVLPLVFVFFTRRGHGWARVIASAMGVYVTVDLLLAFFSDRDPVWSMVPTVISGVAAIGATILLMRPESDKYCRAMAEFRKPRPVLGPPSPYPYPYPPAGYSPQPPYPPQYGPGPPQPQVPPQTPPYGDGGPVTRDDQSASDHDVAGRDNRASEATGNYSRASEATGNQTDEGRRASDQS
ncbi:hypothetical protein [Gordonia sp. NPDC003585]|uniref:hypothetical protein n=1 Tax=Gordonia sp. NPDC003585 TaxID=3154275 RepID=UPI0033A0F42D